jgi:hypothetical protein
LRAPDASAIVTVMGPLRTTSGIVRPAVFLAALALAVVGCSLATQTASAAVSRGVADVGLTMPGSRLAASVQDEAIDDIRLGLRSSYARFVVSWADAEPAQGALDEVYLGSVDHAVQRASAEGLRVIITYTYVPRWASDQQFWTDNPYGEKGYDRRYAMKTDTATLAAWGDFVRQMAARWRGRVWGYECWNEPNLHWTIYPQATRSAGDYAARVYVKMLKAFSGGILAGDPQAQRLAGGTAPRGYNATDPFSARRMMTSPQRFAKLIKGLGATRYFDDYSHHAYTPGGAKNAQPEAPPRDPSTTVNLGNLKTLLGVFPKANFYITEYGYQTAPCNSFSGQYVSLETQASYLARAYKFAARYPRVKALLWYLLDDWSPDNNPKNRAGFYTGLRTIARVKKPSWYMFAGGNHLTLAAPAAAPNGAPVPLAGALTSDTIGVGGTPGPIAGKTLTLQRRLAGSKTWKTVATRKIVTDTSGAFSVTFTMGKPASYRVTWLPIVTSPPVKIKAQ